jgi:inhibitor of cysteine peptidase
MLFLNNNPIYIFTGIIILGFVIFMGFKIVREFLLNNLLKQKHTQMRIGEKSNHFANRFGVLTSTALAPVLIFILIFAFSATAPTSTGNLQTIRSSNDILEIYSEFQENLVYFNPMNDGVLDEGVLEDSATPDYESGSDDYSETNVQVQGVDEMDNVITDGKYIYQMQSNRVLINLAYTQSQETAALSNYKVIDYVDDETQCPSGMYVTGLYVNDDYLVVIGSKYEYYCNVDGDDDLIVPNYYNYWYGYNNNVKVYVYDKNDDFALTSEYDLSGNLIGTRRINDNIYIITSTQIPLYQEDIDVENYLPYYSVNDSKSTTNYIDIKYVEGTAPNSFTTFFAIDLENEAVDVEVVLGDSGYNLYVSHNNIYLVGNIYDYSALIEVDDREDSVLESKTAILKISIDDADLEFATTGTVSGYTLNQFSMDEQDGYLRIATTTGWWGENINNRVFVLDQNLDEISRLENLGKPRETIRSVRFVGDYGYVVTFEQTDPFYVINLSDPENPYTEGELEIPGFSTYLQPLNDTYMLGIGFGDSNGGTDGLKISMYDISDKTNPIVFDEVIFDYGDFGWGSSSATYNHKDLLVSLDKGIIALPFSTYVWSESNGYKYNSGILVYEFDEVEGLTRSGYITHEQNSDENVYVYKIKFIDQYFYTVSDKYIKASLISDPETILNSMTIPDYQYDHGIDDTVVE